MISLAIILLIFVAFAFFQNTEKIEIKEELRKDKEASTLKETFEQEKPIEVAQKISVPVLFTEPPKIKKLKEKPAVSKKKGLNCK